MIRPLLLLTLIGAAVGVPSPHRPAAPVPPTVATSTPKTSSPPTTPRATPTRASRSRAPGPLRSRSRRSTGTGSLLHWAALRQCENSGRYTSKPTDHYRGAYQFDLQTWRSVGGSGDPADASPAEQDYRARLLYQARGRQPWPVCGRYL